MKFCIFALVGLMLLAALPARVTAVAPQTMSFQGVLADASGKPVPEGPYTITFRLYDALADGILLWTEADKPVTVAGGRGVFSTTLGEPTPFGALAFDAPYFLEVQVAGEAAPMAPRLPLQGVPYALNASSGTATLALPFSGSISDPGVALTVQNTSGSGVRSITAGGRALWGTCTGGSYAGYFDNTGDGIGMQGTSISNVGVGGISNSWYGVAGTSLSSIGVYGKGGTSSFSMYADASGGGSAVRAVSVSGRALWATCSGASYGAFIENTGTGIAVNALANGGIGVAGNSVSNTGVHGQSNVGWGVRGVSNTNIGVLGESTSYEGVRGVSNNVNHGGVVAINNTSGAALYALSVGGGYAGYFDGKIRVTVIDIAGGSDVAEKFDTSEKAEPGTVMAIDPEHSGKLCVARGAYNTTVAGVISGANNLGIGMVLPDAGGVKDGLPVAMTGRVWVKCDASYGPIRPGDLLTTSDTAGQAMKVTDHTRSPGATLGKAMTALADGRGLVLTLVNLQ